VQSLLRERRQSIRGWVLGLAGHLLGREPLFHDVAQTIQTASILLVNG
jgi:hypothetical protein